MSEVTIPKLNLRALGKPTPSASSVEVAKSKETSNTAPASMSVKKENPSPKLQTETLPGKKEVNHQSPDSDIQKITASVEDSPIKKEKTTIISDTTAVKKEGNKISFSDLKKPEVTKEVKKVQELKKEEKSESEASYDALLKTETDSENNAADIKKEKEKDAEKNVHFHNYESSFEKQTWHVIKKLQNFKYAPKTRVWFLLILITLTAFTLGTLMLVFPEKHSYEIYKASIIELYSGEKGDKVQNTSTNKQLTQSPETPENTWSEANNIPEIKNPPPSSNNVPEEKVKEQKERLRQHLLDKYSN